MINGRDLILSINGTAVAASKSCKLDVQQNFIASCAPTSGRVKNKIPTDYTWSVSTDCLIADPTYADNILSTLIAGTAVVLRFYDQQLRMRRTGSAYISSVSVGASIGSISTLSVAFEGSGALTGFTEETVSLTDATEYENKRIIAITNPATGVTTYQIGNYSGLNLYAKSIVADMPCRMKVVRTSGSGYIIAADEATTQSLVSNNSDITNLIKIKGTSSTSYITLPAGAYTFIGNTNTGIGWKIMGVWHYED